MTYNTLGFFLNFYLMFSIMSQNKETNYAFFTAATGISKPKVGIRDVNRKTEILNSRGLELVPCGM